MHPNYEYLLQFNNDEASCVALHTMIAGGWTVQGYREEDGYRWLILKYEEK